MSHREDSFVRVHSVIRMVRHPDYSPANYDNDIALWRLELPADPHHFRTICLPRSNTPLKLKILLYWLCSPGIQLKNPMTVAGWGVTKEGGYTLSQKLQQVSVPVVSRATCVKALNSFDITDNMLCAGGLKGQDACQV